MVIEADQTPINPSKVSVMKHNSAMRLPASCQPSSDDNRMPILGGMLCRMNSMPFNT
ncbi:hypothetical protein D3C79_1111800 [compost metagenome]